MPEGHSVHRIARQFRANFVGKTVEVSSPQGRFAAGARRLTGHRMTDARAVGKQLFLGFEHDLWMRVHLGIYGAWDFAGEVRIHPGLQIHGQDPAGVRLGQDGMSGPVDADAEDSVTSIGAPRVSRLKMSESEREAPLEAFPPDPVGQVRARILSDRCCADVRGPTVCEVQTPEEMAAVLDRLGPDPANDDSEAEAQRFLSRAGSKKSPIALVLMDQSVIAGIGNVYRAEMLFRARLDPHAPAHTLPEATLRALWDDWRALLSDGIRVGQMMTIDGLEGDAYLQALRHRDDRHWVYRRAGEPCRRCGTRIVLEEIGARKLYWCPGCQILPVSKERWHG